MLKMFRIMILIGCILVAAAGSSAFAQDRRDASCTTPDNFGGRCQSITSCPKLIKLVYQADNDTKAESLLRNSKCGGNANVCCPLDANPLNQQFDDSLCGKSTVSIGNKITGGVKADLGAWPWLAAIGYVPKMKPSMTMWGCGGALISNRHILTAAHCIHPPPPYGSIMDLSAYQCAIDNNPTGVAKLSINTDWLECKTVRLGEYNLKSDNDGASPVDYGVEWMVIHKDHDKQTKFNDLAIIKLDREVQFTKFIRPICLPSVEQKMNSYEDYYPFAAGWGATVTGGDSSDVLMQVQVPVTDNESCKRSYRKINREIWHKQLCAGYKQGVKDSCQGDSGGPLMLPQNGTYYQIGVISYGKGCGEPGFPGVYSRVTEYIDWIKANMY